MDPHDPLIDRLRELGRQPVDAVTAARHLGAMADVGGPAVDARPSRGRGLKLKVGTAFFAGLLLGGTGLASAGALPGPAQDVAHTTLSKVGLDVPDGKGPARYNGPECTGGPYKNHGQYVRSHKSDPNAAQSRCGKPIQAGSDTTNGTGAPAPNNAKGTSPTTTEQGDNANNGKAKGKANGKGNNGQGNNGQGDSADTSDTEAPEAPEAPEPPDSEAPVKPAAPTAPTTTSSSTTSTTPTTAGR